MPGELQELEAALNLVVVGSYLYITERVATTTNSNGYAKGRDEFSYYHQHHPSPHRLYLYLPNYVSLWLAPFPGVIKRRVGRTSNQPGPPSTRGEANTEKYNDTQIPMHKFRVRCCWWRWKSRNETRKIDLVSPHSSGHPELHILERQAGS